MLGLATWLSTIEKLTIEGFKSIGKLEDFELGALNVPIGANGAGKTPARQPASVENRSSNSWMVR